jgi:hypothetical protein
MIKTFCNIVCLLFLISGTMCLSENLFLTQSLDSLTNGQQGSVQALAFNNDGSMLLTVVSRVVTLWQLSANSTFSKVQIITAPDILTSARFDNSGLKIAGGATGSLTHIWRFNPSTKQY